MADAEVSTPAPETPSLPSELPVVPLRETVVLPMTVAPLGVGRTVSIEAINRALAGDRMVLLLLQRGDAEEPSPDDLQRIGTVAIIRQMAKAPTGMRVLVEGIVRARAEFLHNDRGFVRALLKPLPETAKHSIDVDARVRRLQELVDKALSLATGLSPDIKTLVMSIDDPLRIVYVLASLLDMKAEDKQRLLEENDIAVKLDAISMVLSREIEVLELKGKIESKAEKEMTDAQRQYVLRQQMKAIQNELGEGDGESAELRKRVAEAGLPESVATVANREVDRLERMTPASPEYQMIRTYVDWILDVPWDKPTEDRLDPVEARKVLDADHYDLDKVKERIVEYLAVRKLKGDLKGPILCFVGPPGVGKTSLGAAIADALGRKFVRMAVGGVTDESEIRGHRKTYIGAMPGKLIQSYIQVGVNNPLIMIDEIDKIGKDFRGDPASALLEVLDPKQNHAFVDRYLEIPYDLSHTLFIATANVLDGIPGPLRDRMEVIRLAGYTENEKLQIAKKHLIAELLENHGLDKSQVTIDDDVVLAVIRDYTAEAGVRNLERKLATIMRKIARKVASGTETVEKYEVKTADVEPYLGLPAFEHEFAERHPEIGVTTGLAWTSFGGEIMFIEATRMPGSGRTTVTGQLGDVMRESVSAAYSYVRSKAKDLNIEDRLFNEFDIHIHFPAGAIPKDGPSAGVAIASCIASVMGERPVRHDVAMTGEITLRGKVLSVGGIKEKVMAAQRANIKTVVLPEGNRKDLTEVPEEVKQGLTFVFAERVEDVWKEALIPILVSKGHDRKYDEAEYRAERQQKK